MEADLKINVATLDSPHRKALEDVIGCHLDANQWLVIRVTDRGAGATDSRPVQSLDDWAKVYDGLSEEQIKSIDIIAKSQM